MTKAELRRTMRSLIQTIATEDWQRRGAVACRRLIEQPEFSSARTIMIYLPMAREAATSPLAVEAWARGKEVCAPRVDWERCELAPIRIHSIETDVCEGARGLFEPTGSNVVACSELDLVVTPGLAFDARGGRLGRGAGFYDRFLSQVGFRGTACGLGLDEQVVEEVPCEAHDVRLALVVSDQRICRVKREPGGVH